MTIMDRSKNWGKSLWVAIVPMALALLLCVPSPGLTAGDRSTTQDRDLTGAQTGGWEQQAASRFRLTPEIAGKVMTQQQWQEHSKRMEGMSPQERAQYSTEWHKKFMGEARAQGMTLPEISPEHGKKFKQRGATS